MEPVNTNPDIYAVEMVERTEQYAEKVKRHYNRATEDLLQLASSAKLKEGAVYRFADHETVSAQANIILRNLYSNVYNEVQSGVSAEWGLANLSSDSLIASIFGKGVIEDNHFARWFSRNEQAMDAFLLRKENGLNLSQRVWKYTGQLKDELELALSVSLGQGHSAAKVWREVRKYLQDPDRLFRRVRNSKGNLKLSKKAKAYNPGMGTYRSSYKNAMRVARTETNMAYRGADYERWGQLDFVIGIDIQRSKRSSFVCSVCSSLVGRYPKEFKFTGWHPHCLCYSTPVLITPEEMVGLQQRMLSGEDISGYSHKGKVTDVPASFSSWIKTNTQRINKGSSVPYFIKDNFVDGKVSGGLKFTTAPVILGDIDINKFIMTSSFEDALRKNGWNLKYDQANADDYNKVLKNFNLVELGNEITSSLKNYGIADGLKKDIKIAKHGVQIMFQSQQREFIIVRDFYMVRKKLHVEHSFFKVPRDVQGKGISKQVFQSFYKQYNNSNVSNISVHANIDIGGYTWAKYGFTAHKEEVLSIMQSRLKRGIITEVESDNAMGIINQYFTKNKTSTSFEMRLLADTEYGKRLLLGSDWEGNIDLLNPKQKKVFEDYLFR